MKKVGNLVGEQMVQRSGVFIKNVNDTTQWRYVITRHVLWLLLPLLLRQTLHSDVNDIRLSIICSRTNY